MIDKETFTESKQEILSKSEKKKTISISFRRGSQWILKFLTIHITTDRRSKYSRKTEIIYFTMNTIFRVQKSLLLALFGECTSTEIAPYFMGKYHKTISFRDEYVQHVLIIEQCFIGFILQRYLTPLKRISICVSAKAVCINVYTCLNRGKKP